MCLTVLGRESVEQLEDWVTSLFSGVEDRDVPEPVAPPKPFLPSQLGRRLRVVPVKDLHNIIVLFPTSPLREHYRSSPTRYLAHLIGHEGPGSILAYLRRRNWANELSAGPSHSASGFSFFEVSIEATEEVCRRRCQSNAASPVPHSARGPRSDAGHGTRPRRGGGRVPVRGHAARPRPAEVGARRGRGGGGSRIPLPQQGGAVLLRLPVRSVPILRL